MGWFDNEQGTEKQPPPPQPKKEPMSTTAPPKNMKTAQPNTEETGGSTLGPQIHVDGTIVCGEDLTILGRVEGTIRAKGTLTIARDADVRASIDGQRVLLHGKVEGDVQGAERVVLGPEAQLDGNIQAPALEISEGAYFKGKVDMQPKSGERGRRDKSAGAKSSDASAGDKNKTGAASPSKDGGGSSGESESIEPKAATAGKTKGAETTASR